MDNKNNEGSREEVEDGKSIVNLDPNSAQSPFYGKLGHPQQYH